MIYLLGVCDSVAKQSFTKGNTDSNKEKQLWVKKEKKKKASGNNKKRPCVIERKNENREKKK